MQMLVDHLRNATIAAWIPRLMLYINTIAQRASFFRQCKATERYENVTSLHSIAQPITDYHAYWRYTKCLLGIPPYSRLAEVVPLYKHIVVLLLLVIEKTIKMKQNIIIIIIQF